MEFDIASYKLDYLLIRASKLGSGRSDLFDTSFLRHVGHSLLLSKIFSTSITKITTLSPFALEISDILKRKTVLDYLRNQFSVYGPVQI